MADVEVLGLDGFCDLIAETMALGRVPHPDERLVADLELDSLDMLEILLVLSERGVELDSGIANAVDTVRSLHLAYASNAVVGRTVR
jgi:acyl carrier protein